MTIPAIFFGVVLSSAYGTAFHFFRDGGFKKLLIYILMAWAGFWGGHFAGAALGWSFAAIGPINTGMASIGSVIVLLIGDWLSRVEITQKR